ncbi:hypothetical protein H7169_01165 [Candidatus Gracilibacteria bacterium]|nr:hypothetical protein [Candidatus Gracilibacteria bacterium]
MKIIPTYIILTLSIIVSSLGATYAASSDKRDSGENSQSHTTPHPPHDHQETNHIKKLDESMRRKREDEENPTKK